MVRVETLDFGSSSSNEQREFIMYVSGVLCVVFLFIFLYIQCLSLISWDGVCSSLTLHFIQFQSTRDMVCERVFVKKIKRFFFLLFRQENSSSKIGEHVTVINR